MRKTYMRKSHVRLHYREDRDIEGLDSDSLSHSSNSNVDIHTLGLELRKIKQDR